MDKNRGFTLIELLVVIAVIAVLMSVLMPSLRRAREQARIQSCSSQVRQQAMALLMFADENNTKLPLPEYGGNWLWDVDTKTVNYMLKTGMNRDMFFCPANANQQKNKDEYWTYNTDSWDGSKFTNTKENFAISGYVFVLDMAQEGKRSPFTKLRFDGKQPSADPVERLWLRTTMVKQSALREMVLDTVISATESRGKEYPNGNFAAVQGGMWDRYRVYDSTSHLRTASEPLGGTIGFLDGHVSWRPFDEMAGRWRGTGANQDRVFWW